SSPNTPRCPSSRSPPRRWPTTAKIVWPRAPTTTSPSRSTSTSSCRSLGCGCPSEAAGERRARAEAFARRHFPEESLRLPLLLGSVDQAQIDGCAEPFPLPHAVAPARARSARAQSFRRAAAFFDGASERHVPRSDLLPIGSRESRALSSNLSFTQGVGGGML